jgi:hypothetical protein
MKTISTIVSRIIDKAKTDRLVSSVNRKVGYYIERLSKEDREVLKTAKAKDFNGRL